MPRHRILLKVKNLKNCDNLINQIINDQLKKRKAQNIVVEVEIVAASRMKTLNRKYMGENSATDVLSFPLNKIPGEKNVNIGTIVICNDIIKLQAKDHKLSFEGEFSKILRHGVDHLLGLHHK